MSGIELCQEVRARADLAELPIIILTAMSDPPDKSTLFAELGIREMFSKPFTKVQLLQAVNRCLAKQAVGRRAGAREDAAPGAFPNRDDEPAAAVAL
jgi:CheY-like chemotaxis protein